MHGQIRQPPTAAVLDRSRQITIQRRTEGIQLTPEFNQVIHGAKILPAGHARSAARHGEPQCMGVRIAALPERTRTSRVSIRAINTPRSVRDP
ncbi:hypothetical protein [Actinomadura sp. RB99]|uniref:hypothetical protein n=1 Tax=Actinomadura sp. RB99 TaxID=2691577 RepID=UPI001688F87E